MPLLYIRCLAIRVITTFQSEATVPVNAEMHPRIINKRTVSRNKTYLANDSYYKLFGLCTQIISLSIIINKQLPDFSIIIS